MFASFSVLIVAEHRWLLHKGEFGVPGGLPSTAQDSECLWLKPPEQRWLARA
jgi:hypothetical protein